MKREIRVNVFYGEQYGSTDWPPENWADWLAWFTERVESIPAEHRSRARVRIDSETVYDSCHATLEITYPRLETDEEEAKREAGYRQVQEQQRRNELAMLEALKARYEPTAATPGLPQPPDAATGSGSGRTVPEPP